MFSVFGQKMQITHAELHADSWKRSGIFNIKKKTT